MTTSSSSPVVRPKSLASLLAVVPQLLGFTPENSLVILGLVVPGGPVRAAYRIDLPDPPSAEIAGEIATHVAAVLARNGLNGAILAGYGPGRLVTPIADAARRVLPAAGVALRDVLRVEDGRYWSYLCVRLSCCPPEGTPFDPATDPVAAEVALIAGRPVVLPGRDELAAALAPLTGIAAAVMAEQTGRAARTISAAAGRSGHRTVARMGMTAVGHAIVRSRRGIEPVAGFGLAWLTAALDMVPVRDYGWALMGPAHRDAHQRLWTVLTIAAPPGYAAAPACLLAFTAWQCGNGALANIALDQALADTPGYPMAGLMRRALDGGLPPAVATPPMTPDAVAASYGIVPPRNRPAS